MNTFNLSSKRSAFTMIELLLVVGILGVLAAFTVPTFQIILSQLQLSTATTQVTDLLRLSEQKTVTEQQIYSISAAAGATTVTQKQGSSIIYTLVLPSNIVVSDSNFGGTTTVTFTTAGAPSVSGYLTLRDVVRGRTRQIDVRPSGAIIAGPEQ